MTGSTTAARGVPLAFIDTETTGLDPRRHEIFEIALHLRCPSGVPTERAYWLPVDFERADDRALELTGYRDRHGRRQLELGPDRAFDDPAQVAKQVEELTAGAHLVGLNPAFDARFVSDFLHRHGSKPRWHYHLVDVEALIAGRLQIEPPWTSRGLAEAAGIAEPPAAERHTALGDVHWTIALYDTVMGQGSH